MKERLHKVKIIVGQLLDVQAVNSSPDLLD
jgi:hypothetical protein